MNLPKYFNSNDVEPAPQEQGEAPQASDQELASSAPQSPSSLPGEEAGGSPFLPEAPEYEGLRSKFKSPEDLAKSYLELERRLSGKPPEEGSAPPPPANFDAYAQELASNGKLSDETYAKLEAEYRLPRSVVDTYVSGWQALRQQQLNDVLGSAGIRSIEDYSKIATWAQQALPADELQAFNKAVEASDLGTVKMAVGHLYQRYQQATGTQPSLLAGRATGGPGIVPYESTAQVTADMRKPEYKTDPAFRRKVEQRLAVSDVLNHGRYKR